MTETVEDAAQSLEEILSELSHDLRSPLAAVNLNIETALRRVPAQGKVAAALEPPLKRARDIVKQTVLLMDELLADARDRNLRYGSKGHEGSSADLRDVIHDCVAMHSAALHAARCPVTVRCEGAITGNWPRGPLFQIISNLLVNATKYAPGQPIQVHATRVGRTIVLGVADCGPGFSTAEQEHVFDRFHQAPREGTQGGFGLGLWIVRRAVERLGGSLRLISAPGEGALFLIELPAP
jgi:signal transduction histidine kinase